VEFKLKLLIAVDLITKEKNFLYYI